MRQFFRNFSMAARCMNIAMYYIYIVLEEYLTMKLEMAVCGV